MALHPSLVLLLGLLAVLNAQHGPQVRVEEGHLEGIVNDTGRYFLGVPFANPPTGELRFLPPRPKDPWDGMRDAKVFAPGCIQDCTLPPDTCPPSVSEDCLFLDIYTPNGGKPDAVYPSMIFFPGGEFLQGGASTVLYDGTTIAANTETIVIVINYRLGALGFLVNEEFKGNMGFQDQQFAMDWVRRNIHNFGGDPKKVTIFGQSAGATSTTAHLISPVSSGLFSSAIVESNPVALNLNTMDQQVYYSTLFTKLAGCPTEDSEERTKCLMKLDPDTITKAQKQLMSHVNPGAPFGIFYPWTPTVDGYLVPGQPVNMFPAGKYNKVPVTIGTVHDEGWMFIWEVQPVAMPAPEYYVLLDALFGNNSGAVRKMYPVGPLTKDARPQLNNVITDYLFTCPTRWLAQSMASSNPNPVYVYQFNHVSSFYEGWGPDYQFCWFDYVCHASELAFVFDSAQIAGYTPTAQESVLAKNMVTYWGNFANSGNPNSGPGGQADLGWPSYSVDQRLTMNLNLTLGHIANLRGDYCDYWDSVGYFQP